MLKLPRFALLLALSAAAAPAVTARDGVEELFSRHIQVMQPQGPLAQRLIRLNPPAGTDWQEIQLPDSGLRLKVPAGMAVDRQPQDSRVLQVAFSDGPTRPRPLLRIDRFTPAEGDPAVIDAEYAAQYAEEYPEQAFKGKFTVTDSGLLVLRKKVNLALVGGTYLQGAAPAFRVQCAYLSKDRQLFLTFDCSEKDWDLYADQLAQVILSLEIGK